ncbi:MAG: hypothetical protein ACO3JL_18125 [Myxococcota bacterium]
MSLRRCPVCGRTVDGRECFACGTSVPAAVRQPEPVPVPSPEAPPPLARASFGRDHVSHGPPGDAPGPAIVASPNGIRVDGEPTLETPRSTRTVAVVITRALATRFGLLLAAGVPFVLVCAVTVVLFGGERDPMLRRIDGGKAGSVVKELLMVPMAERTPRQYLLLGHAYARVGATTQAIDAYRVAGERGGADDRALSYVLAALDHPFAQQPMEALGPWKSSLLPDRLVRLTQEESWHLRHNALKVLEARQEASLDILTASAIVDVQKGPDCDRRRQGLSQLRKFGRGEEALDAVRSLRERYEENFCIPVPELGETERVILSR